MMRQAAITILAVLIAVYRLVRRRRPERLSAREIIETRLADISEWIRQDGDPDGTRVRDVQAAWARAQERITAESVVEAAQKTRAAITHAGAAEARAVLDDLQRQAVDHPEGIPGPVVAAARLQFDALMRSNVQ